MSALFNEIKGHLDPETGMVLAADGGRDNLIVNSATLWTLLTDPHESVDWQYECLQFLYKNQIFPGIFSRYLGHNGPNSVDNLIGAMVVGTNVMIHDGRSHGENHFWYYGSCGYPRIGDWYVRFAGFPQWMRAIDKTPLTGWQRDALGVAFWMTSLSDYSNTSDKCLSVLQAIKLGGSLGPYKDVLEPWRLRMMRKYPGGRAELYAIYFGKDHPFAKYAPTTFP